MMRGVAQQAIVSHCHAGRPRTVSPSLSAVDNNELVEKGSRRARFEVGNAEERAGLVVKVGASSGARVIAMEVCDRLRMARVDKPDNVRTIN